MTIITRATQIAGFGLLLLGGCTVNNPPPPQYAQPAPAATIVTPAGTAAPSAVVVQPRY